MLAKMPCLIRALITSFGVACNRSARSLTMICGGIVTGPVGFSFTAVARRSCVRVAVPFLVAGRAVVLRPLLPGRFAPFVLPDGEERNERCAVEVCPPCPPCWCAEVVEPVVLPGL